MAINPPLRSRTRRPATEALLKQYRSGALSLSDFTLKRTLGTGSFGRVILSQHKATKHWVAIKVLRKDKVIKMKQVEHTKYEKQILDAIQCPFIVNLLGSFQDAKNLYLVLEYVRGGEMFTHLRKVGRYVRTRWIRPCMAARAHPPPPCGGSVWVRPCRPPQLH